MSKKPKSNYDRKQDMRFNRLKSKVAQLSQSNVNRIDTAIVGSIQLSGTSTNANLSNMQQGDDTQQRDGNQIRGLRLTGRYVLTRISDVNNSSTVRMIVCRTSSTGGVAPIYESIMEGTSPLDFPDPDHADNRHILFDRLVHLGETTGGSAVAHGKINIPLNGRITKFDGTSNSIGDTSTQHYSMHIVGSDLVTEDVVVNWRMRFWYNP